MVSARNALCRACFELRSGGTISLLYPAMFVGDVTRSVVNYATSMSSPSNAQGGKAPKYRFGLYEIDSRSGELKRQGVRVRLAEQPVHLLLCLLERAPEIVSKDELIRCLWPDGTIVDYERGIAVAVQSVRDALQDDAKNPRYIETMLKRGYRFIAPVERENEVSHVRPPSPTSLPAKPQSDHRRTIQRTLLVLIQIMYLTFYVVALVRLRHVGIAADDLLGGRGAFVVSAIVLVTAMIGIAVRLYLLAAIGFDHPQAGERYARIFLPLIVLDLLWAFSPILAESVIGMGLALAVIVGLVYLPFSQRTLMQMTYPKSNIITSNS